MSSLKNRVVKIIQSEQQKEKNNLKTEDSLRNLWDNIKCTNIHIIEVLEKEERKWQKTYLKK